MRIAFVGTRGVPAAYSGFETFVENLGVRLAERGHEVTVYCRRHHVRGRDTEYRGMRLVHVPGIATKHLDTISHTLVASVHALFRRYDVVVMCIAGNSPLSIVPRLAGTQVILNVDGSDWRREKWGRLARAYLRLSEWLAVRLATVTVTDCEVMRRYFQERFGAETTCIAYGADVPPPSTSGTLERLGLEPGRYLLFVGRLVPENCAHHLVEAYERMDTDLRCVVVGDAPYVAGYISRLKRSGPHVIFPGYVFGDGYRELMRNAYAFVFCSEVGGTHPVLVEAMAAGRCVVVNDTPANREVVGEAGILYPGAQGADGLREVLTRLADEPETVRTYGRLAEARATANYSWERVTDQYEEIFLRLRGQAGPRDLPVSVVETERA